MSREEILNRCNQSRQLVRITFKDGTVKFGSFEHLGDYGDLKRNDMYRFVCSDKENEFRVSLFNKLKADISLSIIIMVDDIENIELVIPL